MKAELCAVFCPYCGKRLSVERGGDSSQPIITAKGPHEFIILNCPQCDNISHMVVELDKLQKGGASA